jgi:hypothetical protein
MSLSPDHPPASPPAKPKLSAEERHARYTDRLTTIRVRMQNCTRPLQLYALHLSADDVFSN